MTDLVNLSRIQETSEGDLEFEVELIEMYIDDSKDHLEVIASSIQDLDFLKLRKAAHTLKGASANIGATAMQESALHMEREATAENAKQVSALHQQILGTFQKTETFYKDYLKTIS